MKVIWLACALAAACGGSKRDDSSSGTGSAGAGPSKPQLPKLSFGFEDHRVTTDKPSAVRVNGNNIWGGLYSAPGLKLELEAHANTDAILVLGDSTAKLVANKPTKITVDLTPYLRKAVAAAKIEKWLVGGPAQVPWRVEREGKQELSDHLDIALQDGLRVWAEGLVDTPMLLDGETAGPPMHNATLLVDGGVPTILGTATSFRDIDYVAFLGREYRSKACGPYTDEGGTERKMIDFTLIDLKLGLHERRTGKAVATKLFRAKGQCPSSIDSRVTGDSGTVSSDEMVRWVKSHRK